MLDVERLQNLARRRLRSLARQPQMHREAHKQDALLPDLLHEREAVVAAR